MTDDLRALLHDAVPEPPSVPDRAEAARTLHRRQRRRTTLTVAAVTVAVVGVVAIVPAQLRSGDQTPEPAPAPVGSCSAPDTRAGDTGRLSDDPVAVRLCSSAPAVFDAPEDALVTDPQSIAALVNSLPAATGDTSCAAEAASLIFTYADGHTEAATFSFGCDVTRVGDTLLAGGDAVTEAFVAGLRAQREGMDPPAGRATPPACGRPLPPLSPLDQPAEAVVGVLCVSDLGRVDAPQTGVPIAPADLGVLIEDTVPESLGSPTIHRLVTLIGTTAWGDTTAETLYADRWWPGPQAQKILERLVATADAARSEADATATAADVVRAYLARAAVGDDAGASALWISLVPVPGKPPFDPQAPFEVTGVKRLPSVSAWQDAVAVTVRHGLPSPGYGEDRSYGEVVFTLGRDENGAYRLVNVSR